MRSTSEIDASLVVIRERVLLAIDRAASGFPVVLVTAPSGFGKSVAISHAIGRHDETVTTFRPGRHETLHDFALGLSRALGDADGGAVGLDPSEDDVVERIVAATATSRGPVVLDDFERTSCDPRIVPAIARAIEATRDRRTWIVATRRPDLLPLSRWCAADVVDHPIDETELRFDVAETSRLAFAANVILDERRIAHLTETTLGWPAAIAAGIDAIRASRNADAGLAAAESATRHLFAMFVADCMSARDREFLIQTVLFEELTLELLEVLGPQARDAVARIRAVSPLIGTETDRGFRVNALLRDVLVARLRRDGADAFARVHTFTEETISRMGLDARGRGTRSLGRTARETASRLRDVGQDLVDRGEIAEVRAALRTLDADGLADDPAIVVLAAQVAPSDAPVRAHAELAIPTSVTSHADRVRVTLGLAARLAREGAFARALHVAGAIDVAALSDIALRARVLADAAGFAARAGLVVRPGSGLAQALDYIETTDDALARALVFRRAAVVYAAAGRHDEAHRFVGAAVVEAGRAHAPRIDVRARAIAYRIARDCGRPEIARAMLHAIVRLARDHDDREMLLFAACEEAEKAALAGDAARLEQTTSAIAAMLQSGDDPYIEELDGRANHVLRRSLALAYACMGDFESALLTSASITAPRSAIARELLYATVTGRVEDARAAEERMRAAPLEDERSIGGLTSRLFCALAAIVRGDPTTVGRELLALETHADAIPLPYVRFLRAVSVAADYAWNRTSRMRLREATAAMSEYGLGGYAMLIDGLPIVARTVLATNLTPSELRILEFLCDELTSRQIAERLGRSVLTIDSHVKAIVRKLKCTGGRRQAVELARAGRIAGLPGRFLFS